MEDRNIRAAMFRPPIAEILAFLETDPKRFAKKKGKLSNLRSVRLRYADGIAWRLVFLVDDEAMAVYIFSFATHDVAYAEAERRARGYTGS
jgi:mRNA-degrading endonuclease RelE of RelBE toxin-antitoxin system